MNDDMKSPQASQKSSPPAVLSSSPSAGQQSGITKSGGAAGAGAQGLLDQATKAASDLAGQAKDKAGEQLTSQLDAQKERAVGSIGGVASALRDAGRSLRSHETGMPTEYVDKAADQIERLTGYVKNRTIGQLAGDLERFARREPAIFLGGAFTVGVLAGRFLKSSGHHENDDATMSARSGAGGSSASGFKTSPGMGAPTTGSMSGGSSKRTP